MLRRGPQDGSSSGPSHYLMRRNLFTTVDDYWIEDQNGIRIARINSKLLPSQRTLVFEDGSNHEICSIADRTLRIKDSLEIQGSRGERAALVEKAFISPNHDRWTVRIGDDPALEANGVIQDQEYTLDSLTAQVAKISKKWFHERGTYGVEVSPGHNEILILAVTVAIDAMALTGNRGTGK